MVNKCLNNMRLLTNQSKVRSSGETGENMEFLGPKRDKCYHVAY
uniref:Uncharacterized protein n=1 Tax=Nelumbo nucifera TaxID=4432 RepID=A0A822YS14_NELNU|nr:TPA_asm: hypothetical protein HUJ06_012417 [Nelumbo nucifera]